VARNDDTYLWLCASPGRHIFFNRRPISMAKTRHFGLAANVPAVSRRAKFPGQRPRLEQFGPGRRACGKL
jgi:hypothetical protein